METLTLNLRGDKGRSLRPTVGAPPLRHNQEIKKQPASKLLVNYIHLSLVSSQNEKLRPLRIRDFIIWKTASFHQEKHSLVWLFKYKSNKWLLFRIGSPRSSQCIVHVVSSSRMDY